MTSETIRTWCFVEREIPNNLPNFLLGDQQATHVRKIEMRQPKHCKVKGGAPRMVGLKSGVIVLDAALPALALSLSDTNVTPSTRREAMWFFLRR
jgi:hypothetical protein